MSYGFKLISASGITQIDDNYANILAISSGTLSGNSTFTGSIIPYDVQTSSNGILFLRSVTNVEFAIGFASGASNAVLWSNSNITASYIIGRYADTLTSANYKTGYGLNVFKPDGKLVFSTNAEVMLLVAAFTINLTSNTTYNLTLPTTTKDKYVAINQTYITETPLGLLKHLTIKFISDTQLSVYSGGNLGEVAILIGVKA